MCNCDCSYIEIVRRVPLGTAALSQDAPLETVDGDPSRVQDMLASLLHSDLVKPLLLIVVLGLAGERPTKRRGYRGGCGGT